MQTLEQLSLTKLALLLLEDVEKHVFISFFGEDGVSILL